MRLQPSKQLTPLRRPRRLKRSCESIRCMQSHGKQLMSFEVDNGPQICSGEKLMWLMSDRIARQHPTSHPLLRIHIHRYMLGLVRASLQRSAGSRPEAEQHRLLAAEVAAKLKSQELTGGMNCEVLNSLATALIHSMQLELAAEHLLRAAELCEWDDQTWSNLAYAISSSPS